MDTGEIKNEKVYASPRPPPKISLKNDWMLDKQKAPNQPNQTQIQFTEQGDMLRQNERPVGVLRKSTHVSRLAARAPICLLNV